MLERWFVFLLAVGGAVSAVPLLAIILFLSPENSGDLGKFLLSVLAVIFLTSAASLAGIYARRKYISARTKVKIYSIALREGAILGFLTVYSLWLLHFKAFGLWSFFLPLLALLGVEYYILSRAKNGREA